jgi:hypothetical protein
MQNTKKTYEDNLPNQFMFPLTELQSIGVLKISMAKKLLSLGLIESVKIGSKHFITKEEILRYLVENTVSKVNPKDMK